ncbi:urea ABC transporter substrate-binding protein [Terrilactibacillus sp. BCM23-1]|uniref:Urea ABC transporter substrate-binding protein n=1 Tax=Terrilactibacillus tamarindi TaxID=2599694 RepID=A0A6N8CPS9_9BACI|nr:urea ABC transporter substrate-binding protein [Terrilactibacillus tamarindi]MTT32184.1 urea ABC transporter substrate-binding protein [Terrilactibacillus tamarindi]
MKLKKLKFKRSAITVILLLCLSISLFGCNNASSSSDGKTIKLGVLEDRSGDFSLVGIQKYYAAKLAVEEINKNGGLLGKKVEMVAPDTQSDNNRYQEMAKRLILNDHVDAIMGAFSSASREAIRPIMEQNKMLYFYNNQYEGGVASKYTFNTGAIPDHQITPLIKEMIKNFGPKVYTIAADYNFGQISAKWVEKTVKENGGQVVNQEFIPLGVSQFSSTISRIKKAKPDVLVTLLVGQDQSSFYEQWAKSGDKSIPMASTVNMAQAYEHKRFAAPALANMYITATYMEELADKYPSAKTFVDKLQKKFPKNKYVGMEAESEYSGIMLWAKAVKKAKTTKTDAVIKALESGISYNGPAGKVSIDPKTHHTVRNVYLVHTDSQQKLHIDKEFKAVKPDWLSKDMGVDLTKKPEFKQYTPLK